VFPGWLAFLGSNRFGRAAQCTPTASGRTVVAGNGRNRDKHNTPSLSVDTGVRSVSAGNVDQSPGLITNRHRIEAVRHCCGANCALTVLGVHRSLA
jgi:hypothetical protein